MGGRKTERERKGRRDRAGWEAGREEIGREEAGESE